MVNISQESGAFFQTDAEIAKQKEKEAKYNYTAGDAVKLSSKALSLCISPDGKYIYIAESGFQVRKMERSTMKSVKLFKGHKGPVTSVVIGKDDTIWTGSWDKTIKKWDAKSGECLATLEGHTDFVKALVISGDSLYSGSSDCFLRRWNLDNLECTASEKQHRRPIESLAISLDGQSIFSASSDGITLRWDTKTMQVQKTYTGHDTSIYCIRVWEDDLWTASADKTVRRWNTDTGVVDMKIEHPDRVKSLALAGPYVVTGSSDDEIRVWDIASGQLVCVIEGHFDEVSSLEMYGSTIYSGSLDCSIRRWPLNAASIKEYNETREKKKKKEQAKDTGLTEEEERELAELLSDDE
ncbi:WD40 repeat-like protein [Rhizopus microsporus var. microsporus]|uniref:WD40 repeat-like protein n=2 Tax=Rhizopus microsporus TaxID=58291 RepID=A0A2G4SG88_RHIZD|nr:WD40 repeat-like protein [Rhizopus microsporus ATCC 52813]ORE07557.1 WD40 repeat-like protein [Rhizopus microsporus var. microsporus]PHZ07777.1 WD40 repeat-like protein [Rhizopus microsporus ATCC 52813]